jgi:glycosyltransferase domain-containing protein
MITVIIATKNRPEFLIRLLKYYAETDFQGWLYIGDSSDKGNYDLTQKFISELCGKLRILHIRFPKLNVIQTIRALLAKVKTPYTAIVSDDDFLITSGISECVDFLDRNSDYVGAHGVGTLFSINYPGAYGNIEECRYYPQSVMEDNSGAQRLFKYLTNYSAVLFSVFRTDVFSSALVDCDHLELTWDRPFLEEILPGCICVSLGKIKQLESLYLIRQGHDSRNTMLKRYEWVTSPSWQPCYQYFCKTLANILVRQDNISFEEAFKVVNNGFKNYLRNSMSTGAKKPSPWSVYFNHLKRIAKTIPGIKKIRQQFRNITPNTHNQLSLSGLLKKSSPHYTDFLSVHKIVTRTSTNLLSLRN